jgi:hypothetical protein
MFQNNLADRAQNVESVPASGPRFAERHYSVGEVAELWGLSTDMIRGIFDQEPGVIALGNETRLRGRRRYVTIRIPESVLQRVHRRLSRV